MPRKSQEPGTARYRALRDVALPDATHVAGDLIDLDPDLAAQLVRDGMVAPAEEGS